MRRKGLTAILALMMIVMSAAACFAGTGDSLKLVSSYPKDGQKNTSIENLGVKLRFNNSISSKKAQKNNKKCVRILNKNGKAIPIKVLTRKGSSGTLLVLGDSTKKNFKVDNNAKYTLVIDKDFVDDEGNTLGEDTTVEFQTFNQRLNTTVNMILMFAMFGGITFLTIRQQNQQNAEKEASGEKKEAPFNPYREAKKTGKSVEEVIEEEKKRREKLERKAARKKQKKPEDEDLDIAALLPYVYKVHEPKPISEAGSTFKSGRGPSAHEDESQPKRTQSATRRRQTGGKK
jgi:preprotein translocase subunit YajC